MKIVEVTRPDGHVQYFESLGEGYSPIGGGFVIKSFGKSSTVKEVDSVPQAFQVGFCFIDDSPKWKCVCDPLDRWNGWAKPYIMVEEAQAFIANLLCDDYSAGSCIMPDGSIKIVMGADEDEPEVTIIPQEEIIGHKVYDLGGMGWVFDFNLTK